MNSDIIQKFKERLDYFHSNKRIVKLYRGVCLKYLSRKLNTEEIEKLGERLFFLGEKPNYCWNDKENNKHFSIADVDKNVFEYIFDSFSQIKENRHTYTNNKKNLSKIMKRYLTFL